tara:strand:- start:439 stop:570 length:132 start_codon:yes stop_codon:yes gene_type:complete
LQYGREEREKGKKDERTGHSKKLEIDIKSERNQAKIENYWTKE